MKTSIFVSVLSCILGIWSPSSLGSEERSLTAVSDDGSTIVLIYASPCQNPTLGLIKPEFQEKFHKATFIIKGKIRQGCWTEDKDGAFVVDEDSAGAKIPKEAFHPTEDI